MIWTYLIIFLLAAIPFFEVALIVPVAIIGGVPTIPTIIIAFLGNFLTLALLIVFIDNVRNWRKKKAENNEKSEKKNKRAKAIWDKYGLPGFAFIGPFFLGSHLTALLAVTFGGTRGKTLMLMTASIAFWAILLGALAHYGFTFFIQGEGETGFIEKIIQMNNE